MSTADALKKLANREVNQVWLLHGGRYSVIVTYDPQNEELIFRFINGPRRLSIRTLLFQTEPGWVL